MAVAAAGLALALARGPSAVDSLAQSFVRAWRAGDYAAMYADIDAGARRAISPASFAAEYRRAAITATMTAASIGAGSHDAQGGEVVIPVRVRTHLFGTIATEWRLPVQSERSSERIRWSPSLLFPGVPPGGSLQRRTELPTRATLLARDGSVLAEGSPAAGSREGQRASPLGAAAEAVVGDVGPIPAAERGELEAQGVPADATVGTSGLERAFDARLRGRPGGELLAAGHVIARATAQAAAPLRTTISPAVQQAAVVALGGQLGGVLALQPRSGEVLAVAGLGIDDLQPPGSTFKIVTVTAVLQSRLAQIGTSFPDHTETLVEGVSLKNASGESCGGTLAAAFAISCNSVFVPLGIRVGAKRLVGTAEAFGFNRSPGLPGAVESTIPAAAKIPNQLELGSSAIGQGEVLASPLEMGVVAATIADSGERPQPTFLPRPASAHGAGAGVRVIDAALAHAVRSLMVGVVRYGTGVTAAIPGVEVAGKTGTAELGGSTCAAGSSSEGTHGSEEAGAPGGESCAAREKHNTDAWFAAFAPARAPRIAVGVMMVRDGFGGESAAPVARAVLEAGLAAKAG